MPDKSKSIEIRPETLEGEVFTEAEAKGLYYQFGQALLEGLAKGLKNFRETGHISGMRIIEGEVLDRDA